MLEYLIGMGIGATGATAGLAIVMRGRIGELIDDNAGLRDEVAVLLEQIQERDVLIADRDGRINILKRELANATAPLKSVAKTPAKPAAKRKAAK